jgi:lipopolysaccharide transport system ATP-binding protein
MTPAIEVVRASKIYRRFSQRKQFSTLKSALLSGSLISSLRPDETFTALNDVSLTVPKGTTLGVIGRNGSGKSTLLKLVAGISKPTTGTVRVVGRVSALIRIPSGDLRPRERLHQWHHARPHQARGRAEVRRNRRVRRAARVH